MTYIYMNITQSSSTNGSLTCDQEDNLTPESSNDSKCVNPFLPKGDDMISSARLVGAGPNRFPPSSSIFRLGSALLRIAICCQSLRRLDLRSRYSMCPIS